MNALPLRGRSILVVEDEPLIALDLKRCLEGAGAYVLCASTLAGALRLMDRPGLSAAVLDYSLTDGDCRPVSARLMSCGVPLVIYSGYPDLHELFPYAVIVPKPTDLYCVVEAVSVLLRDRGAIVSAARASNRTSILVSQHEHPRTLR